jgi:hypothetical protein
VPTTTPRPIPRRQWRRASRAASRVGAAWDLARRTGVDGAKKSQAHGSQGLSADAEPRHASAQARHAKGSAQLGWALRGHLCFTRR